MGQYKFSEAAKDDLAYLYEYGIIHFGLEQANDYYDGLTERFEFLSDNPGDDVLIVRVLGDDMDFERQFS